MAKSALFDPEWQHKFATVTDGVQLHYVETGPSDGLPVVMVHGWPDLWFGWRHQIRALSPKYRLIVPDMRGYGQSSTPQNLEAYGTKKNADDLAALLDAINIPKAVFLGHDWGGKFVWRMCLYHPERVIAVCGVCTPYLPPRRQYISLEVMAKHVPQFEYQLWLADSENAGKVLDKSPERIFRALFRRPTEWASYPNRLPLPVMISKAGTDFEHPVYSDPPNFMSEEELQYYVQTYSKAGFTSAIRTYGTTAIDFETELNLPDVIPHRALFIAAADDPVLKPEMGAEMAKFMPNLETVYVKEAGHWVLMEQPEEVNKALLSWLATIDTPVSRV